MDIRDKIKIILKRSKGKLRLSKRVLLLFSASLLLLLVLAAATEHYILPMEARGGTDFNLRSIDPLTSFAKTGETVPLEFNVFTNSPGLYELKVYSPDGQLFFRGLKWVGKNDLDTCSVSSSVEAEELGKYDVELLGLYNKNENQSYNASFWIEDLSKKPKRIPRPSGSELSGNNSVVAVEENGSLYISSTPIGSTIYLNGRNIGETPHTIDNIKAGNYSLMLALDGYETFNTKIEVVAGKNISISQSLEEIQPSEAKDDSKYKSQIALFIKAFIIFLIGGLLVYIIIGMLTKDEKKEKDMKEDPYVTIEELLKEEKKERDMKEELLKEEKKERDKKEELHVTIKELLKEEKKRKG